MKNIFIRDLHSIKTVVIITLLLVSFYSNAQLKGGHLLGAMGLQSGTQTPENTLSVFLPAYFYNTTSLRDNDGDVAVANPDLNMFLTGVGVGWVSDLKILGANYGASVLLPFASNAIQGNYVNSKSPFAFSDTYFVPIQLGWHNKKADFIFSYAMYLPTGKYENGASDNSGLGMFINELSAGTTVYFNDKKTLHLSALASYEMNGKKKGTDIKTGDILSLEGGFGKTFYVMGGTTDAPAPKSIINAGLIYYMQFKTTSDEIPLPIGNAVFTGNKDRVMALGAEVNYFHISSSTSAGLRWFGEVESINRFKGNTFFLTLAHVFSFKK
ncbi:transporter [Flavobacterium sp. LS1R49]|uniref:Transporter n=1 Tax=Flavobacterium shii TaxID=2987687 RepID=A0A9X3C787_9FLAO|nr:transporter [Flavobacterium shii]MCV9927958.1 transporter [Flavobacterium shii]